MVGSSRLALFLKYLLITVIPLLLCLTAVRLLLTDAFLRFEYARPHFPPDPYGFSQEDRLAYAPYAIHFLVDDRELDYLAVLSFPDGMSLFNERELHHMQDVQNVIRVVFVLYRVVVVCSVLAVGLLMQNVTTRIMLCQALLAGGVLTLLLIGLLVIIAVLSWQFFFEQFHRLFFEDGTWQFYYSDTLIRLFPEQFWFDAAIIIGLLTGTGALLLMTLSRLWARFPRGKTR